MENSSGEENCGALPPLSLRNTKPYAPGLPEHDSWGNWITRCVSVCVLNTGPCRRRCKSNRGAEPYSRCGTAFGFHVHHNPLPNDPTLPLTIFNSAQGDPSEIGDFNGLVVDTMIRGLGTGDGVTFADDTKPGSLAFRADMGAMQGVYVGEDHKHHHGSFVFI
jgi:hypothetical protein